jgi:hypothetical protein
MNTLKNLRFTAEFPMLSRNKSTDQNNPFNEDLEVVSTLFFY